jgi:hypothetical protein
MSTGLEEDEATTEAAWHQDDSIELDEMCANYRQLEYQKKEHESAIKELEKPLKLAAEKIQAKMAGHKAVRTCAGYTVAWVPFKRKGYTVAESSGERWQLRSPF